MDQSMLAGSTVGLAAAPLNSPYEISTLYVGNLHPAIALGALQDMCASFGPVEHVKVIRDKASGTGAGYAFVRFAEREGAEAALLALSGKVCLGKALRVNWAFLPPPIEEAALQQFQIFVGDLAQDVTDATLFDSFRDTGCTQARVLWDHATGRSKRYGFVSYRCTQEGQAAIAAMHGQFIGLSRVRCRWAQHKLDDSAPPPDASSVNRADANNTNIYLGNIPQSWAEGDLVARCSMYGPLLEARLHKRGGYAFVRFEGHHAAVLAIVGLQGATVDGQVLKCSWGKNNLDGSSERMREVSTGPHVLHPTAAAGAAFPQDFYRVDGLGMPPVGQQHQQQPHHQQHRQYHHHHQQQQQLAGQQQQLAGQYHQLAGQHPSVSMGPMSELMRQMQALGQQQQLQVQQLQQQHEYAMWGAGGGGAPGGGSGHGSGSGQGDGSGQGGGGGQGGMTTVQASYHARSGRGTSYGPYH